MEDIIASIVMMVVVFYLIPLYFWRRRLDSRPPHQHEEEPQDVGGERVAGADNARRRTAASSAAAEAEEISHLVITMKLSIRDYEVPFNSHDMYDVVVDDVKIETLVTHDPAKLISWINGIEDLHRCRLDRLIVGLDIEWCPHFLPGDHSVATLQLCVGKSCLVYQILRAPNIPRRLRQFLEDSDYTFVGVGIDDDVKKLDSDYDLEVEQTKDLRSWAADELGKKCLRSVGLKALVKEVVGKDLDKPGEVRLSRWDNHRLSEPQVMYACLDAYFSFEIGRRLSAWY